MAKVSAEESLLLSLSIVKPIVKPIVSMRTLKTAVDKAQDKAVDTKVKQEVKCAGTQQITKTQSNMQMSNTPSSACGQVSGQACGDNSVKPEDIMEPVYGFYETNASEINSLMTQTIFHEDIEMSFGTIPLPFVPTQHGLFKRQNDVFSGNMAFNQTVSF